MSIYSDLVIIKRELNRLEASGEIKVDLRREVIEYQGRRAFIKPLSSVIPSCTSFSGLVTLLERMSEDEALYN